VPFFLYKTAGFSSKDFGLRLPVKKIFTVKNIVIFLVLSILITAFQYYLSNGGKNFRKEHFTLLQLITGFPLLFVWLFVEAGLVEEFFFRAVLQARLSLLLKSRTAGIVVSGLIFGLAHAPGLYLRGAGSEGIEEQLPFIFFAAYTIVYMSIAGIFLGILYIRTKNLWLVIALHAMVDLIPNFSDFIHTWYVPF
jgi:membrane protease YdiL (CAAX protease family)